MEFWMRAFIIYSMLAIVTGIPPLFISMPGQVFRELVDKFLRSGLKRGVPPLFVNLKPLYEDKEKVYIIEEVVTGYLMSLEKFEKFDEAGNHCLKTNIVSIYKLACIVLK